MTNKQQEYNLEWEFTEKCQKIYILKDKMTFNLDKFQINPHIVATGGPRSRNMLSKCKGKNNQCFVMHRICINILSQKKNLQGSLSCVSNKEEKNKWHHFIWFCLRHNLDKRKRHTLSTQLGILIHFSSLHFFRPNFLSSIHVIVVIGWSWWFPEFTALLLPGW